MASTWSIDDNDGRRTAVRIVGVVSGVLAALSIIASLLCRGWYPWIYGCWIMGPPLWFFAEYFFIFNRKDEETAREQLKIGQDLAQKIWAALIVLLAGIGYFRWEFKP
jgi:hypothetical protein